VKGFDGVLLRGDAWREHDMSGQRVAVIASADEAAEMVPFVVRSAARVKVFQDTPGPVVPRALPARGLRSTARVQRAAAWFHLRTTVRDPWLRRQLTPYVHRPPVVRPHYYAALQDPVCKLYTWPVYAVARRGVRSAEGVEHQVDVIICGEGVDVAALLKEGRRRR